MSGSKTFPVMGLAVSCAVIFIAEVISAQHYSRPPSPPPLPYHRIRTTPPSPIPTSWSFPNEILGSSGGPGFRAPPPGVLIAGHRPPVHRHRGPVQSGSRLIPLFSTSTPTPSSWPSHGPQIQRAQEMSHFEYEVFPHPLNQRRPHTRPPRTYRQPSAPITHRPPPSALAPRPFPTSAYPSMPLPVPEELLRILAQDGVMPLIPSTSPQSRTDRPLSPPPMHLLRARTTLAPNPADYHEGFRVLSDLFMEEPGVDLRSNLVGGSSLFSPNFFPIASLNPAASITRGNVSSIRSPSRIPPPPPPTTTASSNLDILPAKEELIAVPEETSSEEEMRKAPESIIPTQMPSPPPPPSPAPKAKKPQPTMLEAASSNGFPQFLQRMPSSHVSFMFTDPNEGPGGDGFSLYDTGYQGPPPPLYPGGNSILPPPPLPPQSEPIQESLRIPVEQPKPQQSEAGGFKNGRNPHSSLMMMPVLPLSSEENSNGPPPSSEEIQKALSILSRYAARQANKVGLTPHQMSMQIRGTPSSQYGGPQEPQQSRDSLNIEYGGPPPPPLPQQSEYGSGSLTNEQYDAPLPSQQQQSTPIPAYLPPASGTQNPDIQFTAPGQSPSDNFLTTTEPSDTAAAQQDESNLYPSYGPPGLGLSGGYSGGGGGGGWSNGDGGYGGIIKDEPKNLIGAKVEALKSIKTAVTGGIKQITGLKKDIFNAGLNAIGTLGKAKGQFVNSLKIPIVPVKTEYGAPGPSYGPPSSIPKENPVTTLINGVKEVVGGVVTTAAQTGRAAVGVGLSKNEFVKNHFAIKGQAFTETMSKKLDNKNQYFQNVLKHVQSIFEAAKSKPTGGWAQN